MNAEIPEFIETTLYPYAAWDEYGGGFVFHVAKSAVMETVGWIHLGQPLTVKVPCDRNTNLHLGAAKVIDAKVAALQEETTQKINVLLSEKSKILSLTYEEPAK